MEMSNNYFVELQGNPSVSNICRWIEKYKLKHVASEIMNHAEIMHSQFLEEEIAGTANHTDGQRPLSVFVLGKCWWQWKKNAIRRAKLQRNIYWLKKLAQLHLIDDHALLILINDLHNDVKKIKMGMHYAFQLHPYQERYKKLENTLNDLLTLTA